jgi:hypothetical protein
MGYPRERIVKPEVTRWYHCISECVRGASLLGVLRKQWIQNRLQELTQIFSIDVAGFGTMDAHLHVLIYLDLETCKDWSDDEVLTRWAKLYPPKRANRCPYDSIDEWIATKRDDASYIMKIRKRLTDLGWFMKSLKEPLSGMANKADGAKGAFWSARYKSIAVLDEAALLATAVYIDLNPLAAGIAKCPEEAMFTSLFVRLELCRRNGRLDNLQAARQGTAIDSSDCEGIEDGNWLCPIDDRRHCGGHQVGLIPGLSLGDYLLIFDFTGRLLRKEETSVNPRVHEILQRVGTTTVAWSATLEVLFAHPSPRGMAFAFDRRALTDAARQFGRRHLANLNGCPTKKSE